MGIIKATFADFELSDGTEYRIELNKPDQIHLHIDNFKFKLTIEEFIEFSETVEAAEEALISKKKL